MKISVEMATLAVNHSHGDGIPKYLISRSEYLGSENLRSEYLGSEYLRSGGNTGSQPLSDRWSLLLQPGFAIIHFSLDPTWKTISKGV